MELEQAEAVLNAFQQYNDALSSEQELRESVRDITKNIDQTCRQIKAILHHVHSRKLDDKVLCAKIIDHFPALKESFTKLQVTLSTDRQYYKYKDHWKQSLSQIVFFSAFAKWLETKQLVTLSEVEQQLGFPEDKLNFPFSIDLEDYLYGLCFLPNELSRLCTNCATVGDYAMVQAIVQFLHELYAGFQLLNLKNDFLRKKYDSIKYDLKRVEEIVYDLSIRGLLKEGGSSSSSSSSSSQQ